MRLNIVTRKNNRQDKIKKLFAYFTFLCMICAFIFSLSFENINSLFFSIPIGMGILGFGLSAVYYKRYIEIGFLEVQDNNIVLNQNVLASKVSINQNTKLTFFYRGIEGDSFDYAPFGIGFFGYKDGAGNILKIDTIEQELFINLHIKSELEYDRIKNWFKELNDNKISCEIKRISYNKEKTSIVKIQHF